MLKHSNIVFLGMFKVPAHQKICSSWLIRKFVFIYTVIIFAYVTLTKFYVFLGVEALTVRH